MTWHDMGWRSAALKGPSSSGFALWCLLPAEEMPDKRAGMSGVGREEALNVRCLIASREAQVIHKVLMPSILKECQLFRRSHRSRKRHRWWILPCLCNGSSLHASQDHGGSWEYGQRWSLGLTLGMSWVGHTIPHRAELSSVDLLEEKTDWDFPGTIWKPPSRPQCMRCLGTFGQRQAVSSRP